MRLAAILLLVLALGACGHQAARTPADVQDAAKFAGLHLPDGARDFRTNRNTGGINRLVLLSFRMNPGKVDEFLTGSSLADPQPGVDPIQVSLRGQLGWRLDTLTHFEGTSDDNNGRTRQVVIDTADPQQLTVYVAAFSV